jgi:hypothetical protein
MLINQIREAHNHRKNHFIHKSKIQRNSPPPQHFINRFYDSGQEKQVKFFQTGLRLQKERKSGKNYTYYKIRFLWGFIGLLMPMLM